MPDSDWWLLQPAFPLIEVILWRIKLRAEATAISDGKNGAQDGSQLFDREGNELYGEREWCTRMGPCFAGASQVHTG